MQVIHKYTVENDHITVPYSSKLLHFDMQNGKICMWCRVNEHEEPTVKIRVYGICTGEAIPEGAQFCKTLFIGPLVIHYFLKVVC